MNLFKYNYKELFMKYKAVIFDLDGTLLDTIEDLANSMNEVLIKYNFAVHDKKIYKKFVGNGVKNLVKKALPDNNLDERKVEKFLKEMQAEYSKRCFSKTKPYKGIIKLLDYLTKNNIILNIKTIIML